MRGSREPMSMQQGSNKNRDRRTNEQSVDHRSVSGQGQVPLSYWEQQQQQNEQQQQQQQLEQQQQQQQQQQQRQQQILYRDQHGQGFAQFKDLDSSASQAKPSSYHSLPSHSSPHPSYPYHLDEGQMDSSFY